MSCKNCSNFDPNDTSGYKGYCSYYKRYEDPDGSCSHFTSSSSTSGCFLTSACVFSRGLPDTCMELETMRAFRDNVLLQTESGQELVQQYYEVAPQIVKFIDCSPKKDRIYKLIYDNILVCIQYIQEEQFHKALSCYRTMVENLQQLQDGKIILGV